MKNDVLRELNSYRNVKEMLSGIAEELWYIFIPDSFDAMAMLEADVRAQKKRDVNRDKVMAIQKLCGFALRPNEPLRDVIARAKRKGLTEDKFPRDYEKDNPNSR